VQGQLVLCEIAKEILEVFKVTSFDKVFTIVDTKEDAISLPWAPAPQASTLPPTPRSLDGVLTAGEMHQIEAGGLTLGGVIAEIESAQPE
ncbi:MAG: hypothetical protein K2V38_27265, partial [Gemmataceae bacterium]|nr:hypothetical protein [Gemmataceae bacterium]